MDRHFTDPHEFARWLYTKGQVDALDSMIRVYAEEPPEEAVTFAELIIEVREARDSLAEELG